MLKVNVYEVYGAFLIKVLQFYRKEKLAVAKP